ncbi:MAG: SOS response-associated peptidase family protein [Cyanobacteria bacterium J06639_1]
MCGRFALTADAEAIAKAFGLSNVPELPPKYNITPSQPVAVVRASDRMKVSSIQKQTSLECEVGFWQPGRFAWELAKVRPFVKPVICSGQQGLWDVPREVIAQVEGAMSGEKVKQMRLFESVRC